MRKTILLLLIIISINCYSQDYFIVDKDTTFCQSLSYGTTVQGYLRKISYKLNGKDVVIVGRKKVPNVITFYTKGKTIDKIPLRANKPKSYIRYTPRVVDGKLKVYSGFLKTINHRNTAAGIDFVGRAGIYRFFIKMPDGNYYKIDKKKNLKKIIEPHLLKCQKFKEAYTGDFSYEDDEKIFNKIIELYNSLCN